MLAVRPTVQYRRRAILQSRDTAVVDQRHYARSDASVPCSARPIDCGAAAVGSRVILRYCGAATPTSHAGSGGAQVAVMAGALAECWNTAGLRHHSIAMLPVRCREAARTPGRHDGGRSWHGEDGPAGWTGASACLGCNACGRRRLRRGARVRLPAVNHVIVSGQFPRPDAQNHIVSAREFVPPNRPK